VGAQLDAGIVGHVDPTAAVCGAGWALVRWATISPRTRLTVLAPTATGWRWVETFGGYDGVGTPGDPVPTLVALGASPSEASSAVDQLLGG
jgi:hypothetical protein